METTNCKACPFKEQKVHGEGSRILREYDEEKKLPIYKEGQETGDFVTQINHIVERDNEGQYDVVGVAMAPAREEVKEDRVLVGVSGQIFKRTLEQAGITEYYLCNVFLCPITDETYTKQALECCRDVIPEILARKPKLVITLGDLPLHRLADIDYSVSEVEGRVIPSKVGPLLPLKHPAYYWRRPDEFFDFIECMRPGTAFLEGRYEQAGEPTYEIVTHETLGRVKNEIDKHEEIGIDLETTGFFSYGWEPDTILEMGLCVNSDHAYIVPGEMVEEFRDLLKVKLGIYWNAQFDAGFLKQRGIDPYVYFDGMLAHYTLDERPYSHGLKKVAKIYLGADDWEKELDQYIPKRNKKSVSYSVVPKDIRYGYLAKDVTRTFQLKKILEGYLNKKIFWDILMPAVRMFIEIAHEGMRIDPVRLMDMEGVLRKELEEMDDSLADSVGYYINPNSYKQVSQLIYQEMNIPVDPFFGLSTGKAAMEAHRGEHEVIEQILNYREIAKLKNTYIEGFAKFVDRNYRIHPYIKLFGSVTGRLSSENPSIMNIKSLKALKRIFLPFPGGILGYLDIKGNELRWYYMHSNDEVIGEIFNRVPPGDPHHEVSLVAYGAERAVELRTQAKAVVFGRLYQRSRKSIEYQVGKEVIDDLMRTVDGLFPGVGKFAEQIMKQVREKGYLESYFGRRRRFSLLTPESIKHVERQAVNFPEQCDGSDLMLLSMLHLWEMKDKWGIFPFWPVHDSITMNAPDPGVMPEVKKELEDYSYELVNKRIPFIWDMDWGVNWAMDKE